MKGPVVPLVIAFLCVYAVVLSLIVRPSGISGEAFDRAISETRVTFYKLGRAAGINASLRAEYKRLTTGEDMTVEEIEALADEVAGIDKLIKEAL